MATKRNEGDPNPTREQIMGSPVANGTPAPQPPDTEPAKARRPQSADIQALARIDRILADLDVAVACRTLTFLTHKYLALADDATGEF